MKVTRLNDIETIGSAHDAAILRRILMHESETPASLRLSHATFAPGQRVEAHSHADICEVFYILSGEGRFIVKGANIEVEEGSCIRIDAGEVHEVINDGDDDLTMIYFGLMV